MMHKFYLLLAILLLTLPSYMAQSNQTFSWKEFVSNEGNFKILFPTVPPKSSEEADSTKSKVITHWFEASLPENYFAVCYSDHPDIQNTDQKQLKSLYDFVRDIALRSGNSKLVSERDIWLDKKLGREIVIVDEDKTGIFRIYLIDHRLYQVISGTKEISKSKTITDKFLNSFQLIKSSAASLTAN